jgi:hypothetical protein
MGAVTSISPGLSYLTEQGGLLSHLPVSISASALQSASPADIVSLSAAALQVEEVNGIFGIAPAGQTSLTLPALSASPGLNGGAASAGVSAADLNNATPQQQNAVSDQALALQEAKALFASPSAATGTTSVTA